MVVEVVVVVVVAAAAAFSLHKVPDKNATRVQLYKNTIIAHQKCYYIAIAI